MKILIQKIPVTLTRSGDGVDVKVHDEKMKIDAEVPTQVESKDIVSEATKLGEENEKNLRLLKGSMLPGETTREAILTRKILAD